MANFWAKKLLENFGLPPVDLYAKGISFLPPLVLRNLFLNLQRNIKAYRKKAITLQERNLSQN